MKIDEKFKKDELRMYRTTNIDLTCRDCLFRLDDSKILGNTSRCERYERKPNNVLLGEECPEKELDYGS